MFEVIGMITVATSICLVVGGLALYALAAAMAS